MAQFDVYPNSGASAHATPFLVDVQSDLLADLETRLVIPLRRRELFPAKVLPSRLTPVFSVRGMECVLETPKMAAVPLRILKNPVTTLVGCRTEITGAIDFLVQGY